MANVLNRTTGNSGSYPYGKDYRVSVNEPDFPEVDWIWDPDLSAVAGQPSKYWNIDMDSVAAGDGFRVKVTRDAASDNATGDAELWAIEVGET